MQNRSEPSEMLRWVFFALGAFLIIRADVAVNATLSIRPFVELLFSDTRTQNIALAVLMIIVMQAGVLCLVSGWGLGRARKWSRWTGMLACLSLVPAPPWFTMIGVTGMALLLVVPFERGAVAPRPVAQPTQDYWSAARNSTAQKVLLFLSGTLLILGLNGSSWLAERIGLPEWRLGWIWWLYLFLFALANTAIHELSHAFMAWALHQRIRVISIGPFTFSKGRDGYSFQIRWDRLLESSGYVGSVPSLQEHLRLQEIAVIAAGPVSSLVTGLLMLAVFLSLPGTSSQRYWELVALNGIIAFDYVFISIIPVGYSDGSMLFHLLTWTQPGQLLVHGYLAAQIQEEAEACLGEASFEEQLHLREKLLEEAKQWGSINAMAVAVCYQQLGYAKLILDDWPGAEIAFRKCLEFESECSLKPALAANAWALLHNACIARHHVAEAERVYQTAIRMLEQRKKSRDRAGLALTRAMMAELHQRAGKMNKALEEANEGLRILPSGNNHLSLRIGLLSAKAYCEVRLGSVDSGLAAAEQAAEIVRSGKIPKRRRNLAWSRMGELGSNLWRAGQSGWGVDTLQEAISQLELAGAKTAAARHRIKLAGILRQIGRQQDAVSSLPKENGLLAVLRRCLLAERAQLYLSDRRLKEALADCGALLSLWEAEPDASTEAATAKSLLALVCQDTGDNARAEVLAQQAAEVLGPWQHPEYARCLVTLSLAKWQAAQIWTASGIEEYLRQIQVDPLLSPAEKARLLEDEANRLERHGRLREAQLMRSASSEQWRTLGTEPKPGAAAFA